VQKTIPEFLRGRVQWLVWWAEQNGRKTPLSLARARQHVDEHEQGRKAIVRNMRGSANDPANFTDLDDAIALAEHLTTTARMQCGIGYALKGDDQVIVFDFDDVLDERGQITDARVAAVIRDLGTFVDVSPSGRGLHAYCAVSPALKRRMLEHIGSWTPFTAKGQGGEQHSVFVAGGYVTVTGRAHRASKTFNTEADVYVRDWFDLRYSSPIRAASTHDASNIDLDDGGIREQVLDALSRIDPDCDRDTWVKVGMILHKISQGDERGLAMWDQWSRRAAHRYPKPREQSTRTLYRGFDKSGRGVSFGSLIHMAKESGDARASIQQAQQRLQRTIASAKDSLGKLAKARGVTLQPDIPQTNETVEVVAASSVAIEATRWLWTDVVPFGHLCLVSGGVSAGKSSMLLKLAADASHATPLPYDLERVRYQQRIDEALGKNNEHGKPYKRSGFVYYLTSEMHWSQTAVPTLRACGANLDRILFMRRTIVKDAKGNVRTRPFDLVNDLDKLIRTIVERGVIPDMIVLDPITSFMGSQADRNAEQDVRAILESVADFCAYIGIAFIGVLHQNKSLEHAGVGKLLGSVAFGAVARVVLFVVPVKHPTKGEGEWEDGVKHFGVVIEKSNIGRTEQVNLFRLEPSPLLGVKIEYVESKAVSEFMREQHESHEDDKAPKRAHLTTLIKERCVAARTPFKTRREAYQTVAEWCNVSAGYAERILTTYFSFSQGDDGRYVVVERKLQ
jgi:hypothetical protein